MDPDPDEIVWVSCPQRTGPNPCDCVYSVCRRAGLAEHQDLAEHTTLVLRDGSVKRRGACTCGWRAPHWHYGSDAGWQAIADADEHHNAAT